MENWSFELLGGVRATNPVHRLEDLVGKKPGALLALLALSPGQYRSREEVIDLIWPEVDFEEARNRFRQTIFVLRKQLEPKGVTPGSVLFTDRTQIGLTAGQTSDVAQFQQSLRHAALTTEPQERAQHLRVALTLYKGEFAPGFYLDVLLTERERLKALVQSARERLAALEPTLIPVPPAVMVREGGERVRTENRFFGRVHEREHLQLLLQDFRLVTLLGPGGTGKTRLVQELSTERQDASFIGLSSLRNGADIPDAIVSALALPDSTETALKRLQAAFADKPALLILDNVEQLVASGGAEAIARVLEAVPSVRLLVTSRLRLDLPQETVCQLAPLPEDDAVALFVDRARLATSHFALTEENEAAVAELCRRLDGLPLAIELAAARAAILTPQQILERLARRFDLLSDKRRDREERHMSLRAALDWGWSLLAPDVQRFFTQLCVFRGSFSLDAAEVVTGEPLAIDYLQSLADGSFLIREGERFRLLETLREYGAEKLSFDEQPLLHEAHFEYFQTSAQMWTTQLVGETFEGAMRSFRSDYDNCLAALDQKIAVDPFHALTLANSLTAFWTYAYLSHTYIAYFTQLQTLLIDHPQVTLESQAHLYSHLASGHHYVHNVETALTLYEKSLALYRQALQEREVAGGDASQLAPLRRKIAGHLHNVGNQHYAVGHLDLATTLILEAASYNRMSANLTWLGHNLTTLTYIGLNRAFAPHHLHEREALLLQVLADSQEGAAAYRQSGQEFFLCRILANQATALVALGQERDAIPVLEEALSLSSRLESWAGFVETLLIIHYLALKQEQYELAIPLLGATYHLNERWELYIDESAPSLLDSQKYLRHSLPHLLGQEHYDRLYCSGANASVEVLQQLCHEFLQRSI